MVVATSVASQQAASARPTVKWGDCLNQKIEWYASDEALRIADNVVLYQRDAGGWPKNIDMAAILTEAQKANVSKQKPEDDSTIDNGSTYTQLTYLARVYTAKKIERHSQAFIKGVDYLLRAQHASGGWPQYYPNLTGYYKHITFNDGAMIGVMRLLRDIADNKPAYRFLDEDRRLKAERAVGLGIECILKTQIVVEGKRTVWCAQHDEVTLAPAPARSFEPVSLSGGESVGVVRFLMGIDRPSDRVIEAVESAIAWFKLSKLSGVRLAEQPDPSTPGDRDRVVVSDPSAGPLWARFYEIGTNRPIFAGRDGIIKYKLSDIEEERRDNYVWYVAEPAELLDKDYPAWLKKRERKYD
jgi:PelA/Pel-15E family pectate lyase